MWARLTGQPEEELLISLWENHGIGELVLRARVGQRVHGCLI
jgi:hypothetical protein